MTAEAQIRVIKGVVTDADTEKPVAGAQMIFQRVDIVQTMTTKTNAKGAYTYLLGNQSLTFRIIVHAQGYQPVVMENVRPDSGEETIRNFKLRPGEDHKTTYEMTDQEKTEFQKNAAAAPPQKTVPMSDAVKKDFAAAMKFVAEGKYAEGIDEFKKVIEKLPKEGSLHAAIANSYMKMGKNDEALTSYQTAIQLDPQNATYFSNMGLALNSLGKTAESQEALKKAITLDPNAENYYRLGVTLVNSGQTDQALEAFKKSIEADPNYAESYYQLGICLSGKPETMNAATEALKKYISIGKVTDQIDVAKQLIAALGGK
jgi:tetratricopeptide (TPR) repeat protein